MNNTNNTSFHGSDLEKIERLYHINKKDIVSFSANVNPLGVSQKLKSVISDKIDAITRYPERDYASLKESIAAYCGADAQHILIGNGVSELITKIIQKIAPKQALILGPTYSEYKNTVEKAGGKAFDYYVKEDDLFAFDVTDFCHTIDQMTDDPHTKPELVILCNPNNPTGTFIDKATMEQLLIFLQERHILCLVDETYIEFVQDEDASSLPLYSVYENLIILRGISKFFAAPGLRLGYCITSDQTLLRNGRNTDSPWMINSLAEALCPIMFTDADYKLKTKALMEQERIFFYDSLKASEKFMPFPTHGNFMLIKILDSKLDSHTLFEACINKNMMIRECSSYPTLGDRFIRICFMRHEDNVRLLDVLTSLKF